MKTKPILNLEKKLMDKLDREEKLLDENKKIKIKSIFSKLFSDIFANIEEKNFEILTCNLNDFSKIFVSQYYDILKEFPFDQMIIKLLHLPHEVFMNVSLAESVSYLFSQLSSGSKAIQDCFLDNGIFDFTFFLINSDNEVLNSIGLVMFSNFIELFILRGYQFDPQSLLSLMKNWVFFSSFHEIVIASILYLFVKFLFLNEKTSLNKNLSFLIPILDISSDIVANENSDINSFLFITCLSIELLERDLSYIRPLSKFKIPGCLIDIFEIYYNTDVAAKLIFYLMKFIILCWKSAEQLMVDPSWIIFIIERNIGEQSVIALQVLSLFIDKKFSQCEKYCIKSNIIYIVLNLYENNSYIFKQPILNFLYIILQRSHLYALPELIKYNFVERCSDVLDPDVDPCLIQTYLKISQTMIEYDSGVKDLFNNFHDSLISLLSAIDDELVTNVEAFLLSLK